MSPGEEPQEPGRASAAKDSIELGDITAFARRHLIKLFVGACLGGVAGWGVSQLVPKKFKTLSELNVQSSYFQDPVLPGSGAWGDGTGIRNQMQALIQLALDDEFVDTLGGRHGVFKTAAGDPEHTVERDLFRKYGIEITPLNLNAIQVSANAQTAERSLAITTDLLERIKTTLVSERRKILERYGESLRKEIDSCKLSPQSQPMSSGMPSHASSLRSRLRTLDAKIVELRSRFTDEHPDVQDAMEEAEATREALRKAGGGGGESAPAGAKPLSGATRADLCDDLVRKLKNVAIALDMDKDTNDLPYLRETRKPVLPVKPVWPKIREFATAGLLAGLVLSLILSVFADLRRSSSLSPEQIAKTLSAPFLGTLPKLEP